MPRALPLVLLAAAALAGCTLLTDLGGFSDGSNSSLDGGEPRDSMTSEAAAAEDGAADASAETSIDSGKYHFADSFDRPDTASDIGTWIEKMPAFHIAANRVELLSTGFDYPDNLAYRPATESILDAEMSIEFKLQQTSSYPQLEARVQTTSVTAVGQFDGYLFYFDGNESLKNHFPLRRQHGPTGTVIAEGRSVAPLTTNLTYRLRLRVQGQTPVMLTATAEELQGSTWTTIVTVLFADNDPARIATPGVAGFSSANEGPGAFSYDNFVIDGL